MVAVAWCWSLDSFVYRLCYLYANDRVINIAVNDGGVAFAQAAGKCVVLNGFHQSSHDDDSQLR